MDRFRQQRVDKTQQCGLAFFSLRSTCAAFGVPGTLLHANDVYQQYKEEEGEALACFGAVRSMFGEHFLSQISCCLAFQRLYRGRVLAMPNMAWRWPLRGQNPNKLPFDVPCFETTLQKARLRANGDRCRTLARKRGPPERRNATRFACAVQISKTYARRQSGPSLVNGRCVRAWNRRMGNATMSGMPGLAACALFGCLDQL